jgi:hypothetical protein
MAKPGSQLNDYVKYLKFNKPVQMGTGSFANKV